ncbi:aminotransferase class I/II-fold pyridoxal phosphate-dependent enzyme [Akkermansia glycaniphila]|uniref:aminotransferase class I/II-fold pyridoxal phosphate-dependent enzyme n=1 Tax=Akkermansia glycaniphila TaxID=1679444 RepID=UPI001C014322|nr:aminotransferase class I/II-fold pyridoxal phosphate-dependent enzyme [Akkermansia glycaniphila]MBT9450522.1 aminotransferase class I/II-fold pyridoxal phosphate-dependent enzyme [Akkermansia glycaniphila]
MDWSTTIATQVAQIPRSGIRAFFDLVTGRSDIISLGVGEPDFVTPWNIREAAIYSLERGHTTYTSNYGLESLRRKIVTYVENFFGVSYNPLNEVLVTVGVSEAIDLALRALLNPGDEVLYHEPCYVSYAPSVSMAYGVAVPIATKKSDLFALDPAALEAAITPRTKVLMLNFPTNPTGAVAPVETLEAIARLCIKHDLVVLSDEIYSELRYDDVRHTSIASLPGMRERTLLLHGFSKAFAMTGFRLGYACGPEPLVSAMMKVHQYSMLCAPITSQEAAIEALENGTPAMLEMRESYRMRRNYLVKRLNDMGLDCHLPGGAFYVFPDVSRFGLSSKEFAERLLMEAKVAAVPGDAFGASGEGFLRCCYATAFELIREACDAMERFVDKLEKEAR